MKKTILFLLLSAVTLTLTAAKSYRFEISAPQMAADTVLLANYFNGKVYVSDTIVLNKKGSGVFSKNKELPEGVYLIVFPNKRYYDFLVETNQQLKISIDTLKENYVYQFQVKGAAQTEAFDAYIKYMSEKRKEQSEIMGKMEAVKDDALAQQTLHEKLNGLDKQVQDKQANLIETYKNKTLGILIKGSMPPLLPDSLADASNTDYNYQMKRYLYSKNHYWDNIDFSDKRVWRFNYVSPRMDTYLNKILVQSYDTIITEVVKLMEKSRGGDSIAFQIMATNMLNYAAASKLMGMDKLLVVLAEDYYLTPKVWWADSTLQANLRTEVRKSKYNLVGNIAHNLYSESIDGKPAVLKQQLGEITLLYFYEPSCGHCKQTTPKVLEVFEKYKNKGFKVVAYYTQTDKQEWLDFIEKYGVQEWTNVWDPNRESFYWYYYDTSTTPGLYVLDKNLKIIAKKIDAPTLDLILNHELKP